MPADRFMTPSPASSPVLRLSFLGFNPLGDGFDGRGLIDRGADHTFSSLDTLGAARAIRQFVARYPPGPGRQLDLRITGYSFGGWSALQLAHRLGPRYRIRLGLLDPVCTFRFRSVLRLLPFPISRTLVASRPANVSFGINVFQTKGLIARLDRGRGARLPYRARWFASQPIQGLLNFDRSEDVTYEAGHVEVAEKYGLHVAKATFGYDLAETEKEISEILFSPRKPGL